MTTTKEIGEWFDRGVAQGATHMLVVCDTFDYEDFPVYVMAGNDPRVEGEKHNGPNMQRLMEVYDLRRPKLPQVNANARQFNY